MPNDFSRNLEKSNVTTVSFRIRDTILYFVLRWYIIILMVDKNRKYPINT
jgi:hypothetical protein